jgi:hypothetical protein
MKCGECLITPFIVPSEDFEYPTLQMRLNICVVGVANSMSILYKILTIIIMLLQVTDNQVFQKLQIFPCF